MTKEEYLQKYKELFLQIERLNTAYIREHVKNEAGEEEEHEAFYHGFVIRCRDRKVAYDFNKVKKNGQESNIRFPRIEEIDNVIKIELAE